MARERFTSRTTGTTSSVPEAARASAPVSGGAWRSWSTTQAAPKAAPVSDLIASVNIPYEEFTLANGLRVLVHTDRKAPVVAVSVWYDVGSKHEPKGKTGFAHLFEHLMFNGSENAPGDYFVPMRNIGATDLNGTTSFDRTNYFQTVPTAALETTLYLESDRMGYLLGAVGQGVLDEQRGVVQNEKRQADNQPYGLAYYSILEGLFPEGHPYRHSPIGSMADLQAASLEDVKTWFRSYYGPNNAIIALAGDIDCHGPVGQGDWLMALGIAQRAAMLAKGQPGRAQEIMTALDRLVSPEQMGTLFKGLAYRGPGWPVGAGFAGVS
ncbi:MAG: insulinase family protein [Blastomonas sp.]|nr:insulinase family protein [Blastomonas sp.]